MTFKSGPTIDSDALNFRAWREALESPKGFNPNDNGRKSDTMEASILRSCINLKAAGLNPSAANIQRDLATSVVGLPGLRRIQELTRQFRDEDSQNGRDLDKVIDPLSPDNPIEQDVLVIIAKMDNFRYPTFEFQNYVRHTWTKRQLNIVARIKGLLIPHLSEENAPSDAQLLKSIIEEMSVRERIEENSVTGVKLPNRDLYNYLSSSPGHPSTFEVLREELVSTYGLNNIGTPPHPLHFIRYSLQYPIRNNEAIELMDGVERFAVHVKNYLEYQHWHDSLFFGKRVDANDPRIKSGTGNSEIEMAYENSMKNIHHSIYSAAVEYQKGISKIALLRSLANPPNIFTHSASFGDLFGEETTARWAEDVFGGIWQSKKVQGSSGTGAGRKFMDEFILPNFEDIAGRLVKDNTPHSIEEIKKAVAYINHIGGASMLNSDSEHDGLAIGRWVYEIARKKKYQALPGDWSQEAQKRSELIRGILGWDDFLHSLPQKWK